MTSNSNKLMITNEITLIQESNLHFTFLSPYFIQVLVTFVDIVFFTFVHALSAKFIISSHRITALFIIVHSLSLFHF